MDPHDYYHRQAGTRPRPKTATGRQGRHKVDENLRRAASGKPVPPTRSKPARPAHQAQRNRRAQSARAPRHARGAERKRGAGFEGHNGYAPHPGMPGAQFPYPYQAHNAYPHLTGYTGPFPPSHLLPSPFVPYPPPQKHHPSDHQPPQPFPHVQNPHAGSLPQQQFPWPMPPMPFTPYYPPGPYPPPSHPHAMPHPPTSHFTTPGHNEAHQQSSQEPAAPGPTVAAQRGEPLNSSAMHTPSKPAASAAPNAATSKTDTNEGFHEDGDRVLANLGRNSRPSSAATAPQ
mmetsp:Transcript_15721/g.22090  ORF Transcript_15721/g.22090 Transcript_15721/m.22090 type:complete len:287 (-) Transcript_15721:59-919(-)